MFLFQDWVSRRAATSAAKMSTWLTDSFLSCLRCNHPRPPSLWSCCPWTKWQIKLNLCLPALSGNNMKLVRKKKKHRGLAWPLETFRAMKNHDGRAGRDENSGGWTSHFRRIAFVKFGAQNLYGASEINESAQHRLCPLIKLRRLQERLHIHRICHQQPKQKG